MTMDENRTNGDRNNGESPRLRALDIRYLHAIRDRRELLPEELRSFDLVLIFDVLYDADVITLDPTARGGSWGEYFDYKERRQANVKLHLYGFLETKEQFYRDTQGKGRSRHIYTITEQGRTLLQRLKDAAGIA